MCRNADWREIISEINTPAGVVANAPLKKYLSERRELRRYCPVTARMNGYEF